MPATRREAAWLAAFRNVFDEREGHRVNRGRRQHTEHEYTWGNSGPVHGARLYWYDLLEFRSVL